MTRHLFVTAQLIRSAAGFCCSFQPASYSYHHQLFLLFRTKEELWGRLCSPPSRGKSSFQRPQCYAISITNFFSPTVKVTLWRASCIQSNMKKYRNVPLGEQPHHLRSLVLLSWSYTMYLWHCNSTFVKPTSRTPRRHKMPCCCCAHVLFSLYSY